MTRKPLARWSLGFMGLIISLGTVSAQAATTRNTAEPTMRRPPARQMQRTQFIRQGTARRANPARQMSMQQWARFVRTEIPTLDKVERAPFAVEQERRFERGETLVSSSVHTF